MSTSKYPLLSVIIPFYNHNHFITQTLDSILEDTYPNKEIIIINDGSSNPDDSNIVEWIEEHKEEIYIHYIVRENKGVCATMNELVKMAQGEYIVPCASDDYFVNNTFADRINLLINNPKKMIVLADNRVVDNDDNILYDSNLSEARGGTLSNYTSNFGLKRMITKKWAFAGASWLAKRELFNEIEPFDETLIVEDWDFFLKCISRNLAIFYPNKVVAAYRLHTNNTIHNPTKQLQMWEDLYKTAIKHIKSFKNPYFKYIMWRNSRKNLKKIKYYKELNNEFKS